MIANFYFIALKNLQLMVNSSSRPLSIKCSILQAPITMVILSCYNLILKFLNNHALPRYPRQQKAFGLSYKHAGLLMGILLKDVCGLCLEARLKWAFHLTTETCTLSAIRQRPQGLCLNLFRLMPQGWLRWAFTWLNFFLAFLLLPSNRPCFVPE